MIKEIKIKDIIKGWLDSKELPKKFNYFGDVYELNTGYIKNKKVDLDNLYYNEHYCRYFNFTGYSDREETVIIEENILDEKEKEYLSNVIKPFRKRIKYISVDKCIDDCVIRITLQHYSKNYDDNILLPDFKNGSMYKRMEIDKQYTLKELGL
nr:MAG TPA: hypothetical protein [Caudoviricetes sp.]